MLRFVHKPQQLRLTPPERELLVRTLNARATDLYRQGLAADVDFTHALEFLECDLADNGKAMKRHLKRTKRLINALEKQLRNEPVVLPSGRYIEAQDLKLVKEVFDFLNERFHTALFILGQREDKHDLRRAR
jgi:hypothetical protein